MAILQEKDVATQRHAENRQLVHNIIYLLFSTLAINASLFLYNWIIIRWYGETQHGDFVWIVAFSRLGMLISDLGPSSKSGIRTIARERGSSPDKLSDTIASLSVVQLAFALIPAILMVVLASPIAHFQPGISVAALQLAGAWIAIYAVQKICGMICMGLERMFSLVIIGPVSEVAKLVWVFICAICHWDIMWIFVGWTAAYLLSVAVSVPVTRRLTRECSLKIRPRLASVDESLRILTHSIPYYISTLGMYGVPFVMELVVGAHHDGDEVSELQVCFALAALSRLLSTPVATAMFPRFARIDANSLTAHQEIHALMLPSVRLLGWVGTFVFAAYWVGGSFLLGHVYRPAYADSLPALLLLTLALSVENYTQQLDQVLMAREHVKIVAWMEAVKYGFMVALSLVLVPLMGCDGAAWAVCVAILCSVAIKMALAKRAVSYIGAAPFAATLFTFGIVAAVGCCGRWGHWLVLPAWLASVLSLGLLNLGELRRWTGAVLRAGRAVSSLREAAAEA